MQTSTFRCHLRNADGFAEITVDRATGDIRCTCGGAAKIFAALPSMCEHIDATLVMGERSMVPEADRDTADGALNGPVFKVPFAKRDWISDYEWRGRPVPKTRSALALDRLKKKYGADYETRPKVCFTGDGVKSRDEYLDDARSRGWRAVDSFQDDIRVLVASGDVDTTKLESARRKKIPVLSYAEWERLLADGTFLDDSE